MMKYLRATLLVSACSLLYTSFVEAAQIYSQGPTPNTFSRSDEPDFGKRLADDFELSSAGTILSVEWLGIYPFTNNPTPTDDFTIYFYSDAGNTPGSLLATHAVGNSVNRTPSGNIDSWNAFNYRANIGAGLSVVANTRIWLSIVNNTSPHAQFWAWATNFPDTQPFGLAHRSSNGGATWPEAFNETLTFALHDTSVIPEPSTIALAIVGLLIACGRSHK